MLQEDRLQPSDLMAMKAKYTREGKWKYELSNRKRHIKDLFEGEEHELDIALRGEAQKSQPVPRTTMICTWKGTDDEGNLSFVRIVKPSNNSLMQLECRERLLVQ